MKFFFFQAEDGIRDVAVTGVQTCALPISFASAALTIARASGCSLEFSTLAASPSNLSFPNPPPSKTLTAFTSGLPSVSVPVLSTTSVSTLARVSSASAFRTSTPACAPRPTATIIDIGVASPSAQGQAMIKTDTGATSAWAKRGSGPKNIQPAKDQKSTRLNSSHSYNPYALLCL